MEDLIFEDPCVLFALGREARPFLKEFRPQQRFPDAPCWARFCGPEWLSVLVLRTGLGTEATSQALEWLLSQPKMGNVPCRPKIILSAGFAGALTPSLDVGDLVLGKEIVDEEGNLWPTTWPGSLPEGRWDPPLHFGRLVTSSKLVGQPEAKLELGRKFQADAVDMESVAVARLCKKHDVPFGCLRAVSDRADMALSPQLVTLLSRGRVSLPAVLLQSIRRPSLIGELWRLAQHSHLASLRLGKALGELLTLTLTWAKDL